MKDKTLLQALILGLGQVGAKVLSLIFLFRFANDLGSTMLSTYVYAYIPFSIFADLSCFGLIPGTSKLVAQMKTDKDETKINQLLKSGTVYCLLAGLCFFLFLFCFNRQVLKISLFDGYDQESFEQVRINLLLASLSLFVIPLLNFYKGFLQGHMRMYPSCLAIITENVVKILLYVVLVKKIAVNLIHLVFLIYFLSYLLSLLVLIIFILPYYHKEKIKLKPIFAILKTSIPFGIATMFFTIYQLIDSITLSELLIDKGDYTAYMYETIRLIFFPIVIAQALGGALNPKMNYMFKEERFEEARNIALKCSSLIIYILIPLTVLTKYFAEDIYQVFYKQQEGGSILFNVTDLIVFFGLYKVLIGISFGLPKGYYIIIATIISSVAKFFLNTLLIPKMGYLGAVYATITAISICILVSYYVLHIEKISLFWANIKAILQALVAGFFSILIVVVFQVGFYLGNYPIYINLGLYSIFLLGIYYLLLKMFKQPFNFRHSIN